MKKYLFPLIFMLFYCLPIHGQKAGNRQNWDHADVDYSTIIIKLKSVNSAGARKREDNEPKILKVEDLAKRPGIQQVMPVRHGSYKYSARSEYQTHSILDGIYKVELENHSDFNKFMTSLMFYDNILYVEPAKKYDLLYVPNDPFAAIGEEQFYLENIKAYEAWEINQGDSSILIAIIDTGVDPNHEDLTNAIYYNEADTINGVDDDGDGYIDNYVGWDFADGDNDVTTGVDDHGTLVSGISSAETDNGTGIASTGFNSRFLPLKIFASSDNSFMNGFEAIIYAADMGCKVINLSWGSGDGFYSQFEQDVINYAVLEKDVVVIAAAGNTNAELDFLPASYNNVLSVGAVDSDDQKADWATFSNYIDLVAPGEAVFTTARGNLYGGGQGTSFSAPQVSGAAALVRSVYPDWNARQVMEQIRVTTDSIYNIGINNQFSEQLGYGRLNMESALMDTLSKSVRMTSFSYLNNYGPYSFFGDTIYLDIELINFLSPVSDLMVSASVVTGNATLLDSVLHVGPMEILDSAGIGNYEFRVILSENLGHNEKVKLRLAFSDEGYEDYQYLEFYSTPAFFDLDNGTLATTISNNGNLGYYSDYHSWGSGVVYDDEQVINDLGLMIGKSGNQLVDNVPYDIENHVRNTDLKADSRIKLYGNSIADLDARSVFSESNTVVDPLFINVEQKILAWEEDSLSSFQIMEYRIINNKASSDSNLYYGIYADWDLDDKVKNKAVWDSTNYIAIQYNIDSTRYVGLGLLMDSTITHFALDLDAQNGNLRDFNGPFTDSLKYSYLSSGFIKNSSGDLGDGNDVGHIIGGKIDSLEAYETYKTAFFIAVGDSYSSIIESFENAKMIYSDYLENPVIADIVYTCYGDSTLIIPEGDLFSFYADPLGDSLLHIGSEYLTQPVYKDTAIYLVNLDNDYEGDISQVRILVEETDAKFSLIPDTLIINTGEKGYVSFVDQSRNSNVWDWDFNNGFKSTLQNPSTYYLSKGNYSISLVVESEIGCLDSTENTIVVLEKGPKPEIDEQSVCKSGSAVINPDNATTIRVYSDVSMEYLLFEGEEYVSDPIYTDTSFHVTNIDSLIESDATEAIVRVSNLEASFQYSPDTLISGEKYILNLTSHAYGHVNQAWYIDQELYSMSPDTIFNYDNLTSFDVRFVVEDTLGCSENLELEITPKASPTPEVVTAFTCSGISLKIEPDNGDTYYFFSDPEGTELLGKGTSYVIDSLSESGSIWVAGMDSLLEGEIVEADWVISDIHADFSMDPDPLNIREGFEVFFTDQSTNAISRLWVFEINGTDTARNPTRFYHDLGEYNINLTVTDSIGCTDSLEKSLAVINTVGMDDSPESAILIYPNPALNVLNISGSGFISDKLEVSLYRNDGRLLNKYFLNIDDTIVQIQLPSLNEGLYLLHFRSDGYNFTRKIIIRSNH